MPTSSPETPTDSAPEFSPYNAEAFELPEGVDAASEVFTTFLETVNESQLPKEVAQNFVNLAGKMVTDLSGAYESSWAETQNRWIEEARALPDIGGEALDTKTLPAIAGLLDRYGSAEVREVFDQTVGNNPHMVKFLYSIAEDLAEKPPMPGDPPGNPTQTRAELMFPLPKR